MTAVPLPAPAPPAHPRDTSARARAATDRRPPVSPSRRHAYGKRAQLALLQQLLRELEGAYVLG